MFLADKHNFGQQVEKVQRGMDASFSTWFHKPRTVYWEWLFFGKTSPLKSFFNEKGQHGHRPMGDYFFNLDIEIESTWSGFAKEVKSETNVQSLEHFYAFGALIAYSYIFGIRDLHKQNLVMTKTHLQPVDVEVVFTVLTLPHETLLLPFKNVGYEFAGIGALVAAKENLSKKQVEKIIFGYWDLFNLAIKKKCEIEKILEKQSFSKKPARVIIRNTSEYKDLIDKKQDNILQSEVNQMSRGDVPFYFKFIEDKNLYWLKSKKFPEIESSVGIFQRDIDRHAQNFGDGFYGKLTNLTKLVSGLLFLIKSLGQEVQVILSENARIEGRRIYIENQIFESPKIK